MICKYIEIYILLLLLTFIYYTTCQTTPSKTTPHWSQLPSFEQCYYSSCVALNENTKCNKTEEIEIKRDSDQNELRCFSEKIDGWVGKQSICCKPIITTSTSTQSTSSSTRKKL